MRHTNQRRGRSRRPETDLVPTAAPAHGFTLIELLITVAVIAIVSMIAVPNLLNALQHAKQKKTMASIRSLAQAAERYSVDLNRYPVQPTCGIAKDNASIKAYTRGNKKNKGDPGAASETDFFDGWGHELRYHSAADDSYTVCSGGRDGSNCCTPDVPPGAVSRFEHDLVYSVGSFVTYPQGQQE